MGFTSGAKESPEAVGGKLQEAWDNTAGGVGDKIDEMKADADVKKAEAERDSVKRRNDIKEQLRDS